MRYYKTTTLHNNSIKYFAHRRYNNNIIIVPVRDLIFVGLLKLNFLIWAFKIMTIIIIKNPLINREVFANYINCHLFGTYQKICAICLTLGARYNLLIMLIMTVGVKKKKLNISTLPLFMSYIYIYIVNAFFIYRNYQINNWKKSHKQNIFLTVRVVKIKKS